MDSKNNGEKNIKFSKSSVIIGIAVLLIFLVILVVNHQKNNSVKTINTTQLHERALFDASRSEKAMQEKIIKASVLPKVKTGSASLFTNGHISIVSDNRFKAVAPAPKTMRQRLQEMASRKKKTPSVVINENDFDKKFHSPSLYPPKQTKLISKKPLSLKKSEYQSRITKIIAPVDYKLFKSYKTYAGFANTHNGTFPSIDFENQMAIMLVSTSHFPSRIFEIVSIKEGRKCITVKYRINPLAVAQGSGDSYTAVAVSKSKLPIVLNQIQ